jgi:hypothetical protein
MVAYLRKLYNEELYNFHSSSDVISALKPTETSHSGTSPTPFHSRLKAGVRGEKSGTHCLK